jgi:YNFM family putative membrane transporter
MHTLTHRALLAGIVAGSFGQAASADRGAASGIYLACYFFGGLIGSAILGQLFDRVGWTACVTGIGLVLGLAALLARSLRLTPATDRRASAAR